MRELLAQLTGRDIDDTVTVFPPFSADFGKNITIENAVIAAAAVVTKDVPANSVVVGSPAQVVRTLQS